MPYFVMWWYEWYDICYDGCDDVMCDAMCDAMFPWQYDMSVTMPKWQIDSATYILCNNIIVLFFTKVL